MAFMLSIGDEDASPGRRVERAVADNPVVIYSRAACCMCHVMRRLLHHIGVHPAVVELDDAEIEEALSVAVDQQQQQLTSSSSSSSSSSTSSSSAATYQLLAACPPPAVFIGGELVGGLDILMELHLSGGLVPRLKEVGALCWA